MSNTNIITLETVIARINASHMSPARKELNISVANKNANRPADLQGLMLVCDDFDKKFEDDAAKFARAREAQSFNAKADTWEAPAPDMTKNHLSAKDRQKLNSESIKAKLLAKKQAREQAAINERLKFGVGFHEVVITEWGFCSDDDWMWYKLRDIETNYTYITSWYIGTDMNNRCVSDKIVKYMRSEDETIPTLKECGTEDAWFDEMINTQHVFVVHASISKYDPTKLYIMFNHFDDILDQMDEEENPKHPEDVEEVSYKEGVGGHEDKGYARRPTEEAAC